MTSARLSITLFQIVLDVDLWLVLIVLHVLLGDRNVGQNQHLKQALQVTSDKVTVGWKSCTLAEIPHNSENEPFTLTGCSDLVAGDLVPDLLEELVCLTFEVLSELEVVQVNHSDDLGACLE